MNTEQTQKKKKILKALQHFAHINPVHVAASNKSFHLTANAAGEFGR